MMRFRTRSRGGNSGLLGTANAYFDYTNNVAFGPGITTLAGAHTITRASSGYAESSSGIWSSFGSNTLRRTDRGLLVEEARTNRALHCRDMTNAAWVKTDTTAAKDQVGIDGESNSASSLTATAGNATTLQSITHSSTARAKSAFIKRLIGSGVIQMTMDNGATWTSVTVNSSWSRVTIPSQTLANPTVGFRIVTSGDSIAVDFAQCEDGARPSSPILTTTGAATRAADVVTVNNPTTILSTSQFSWFAEIQDVIGPASIDHRVFAARIDGSNTVFCGVDATNKLGQIVVGGGATLASQFSTDSVVAEAIYRAAARVAVNNFGARFSNLGTAPADDTTGTPPSGTPVLWIGQGNSAVAMFNGYIRRFGAWPTALTNVQLEALVA